MKTTNFFFNGLASFTFILFFVGNTIFLSANPAFNKCDCKNNFIQNGDFSRGTANPPAYNINTGGVPHWEAAYNNPQYLTDDGFYAPGYIQMYGNQSEGEAMRQKVNFKKGHTYKICFAFRSDNAPVQYVQFKLRASNRTDITSPSIGTVIGISQKAYYNQSGTWQIASFTWIANADYKYLYVSPENEFFSTSNGKPVSFGHIDDICIQEENNCDGLRKIEVAKLNGPDQLSKGQGATYSLPNVPGLVYTWHVSPAIPFTGQGTNSITIPGSANLGLGYLTIKVKVECNGKTVEKFHKVALINGKLPPIEKTNPKKFPH